jgi:hypothetical protein
VDVACERCSVLHGEQAKGATKSGGEWAVNVDTLSESSGSKGRVFRMHHCCAYSDLLRRWVGGKVGS